MLYTFSLVWVIFVTREWPNFFPVKSVAEKPLFSKTIYVKRDLAHHPLPPTSPSAPECLLDHGFVDKIWDDWQKKSHQIKHEFPSIKKSMPGTKLEPSKLIDLSRQPGGIRVECEPFKRELELTDKIKGKRLMGSLSPLFHLMISIMIYLLLLIRVRVLLNYVKSGAEQCKASQKRLSNCCT